VITKEWNGANNQRFKVHDEWVLDTTTGLYWRKHLLSKAQKTWYDAIKEVKSYEARLPEIQEFISLIDYSQCCPALPKDHPFVNVRSSYYWSATTTAPYTTHAWGISMYYGYVYDYYKLDRYHVWPVKDKV